MTKCKDHLSVIVRREGEARGKCFKRIVHGAPGTTKTEGRGWQERFAAPFCGGNTCKNVFHFFHNLETEMINKCMPIYYAEVRYMHP